VKLPDLPDPTNLDLFALSIPCPQRLCAYLLDVYNIYLIF